MLFALTPIWYFVGRL